MVDLVGRPATRRRLVAADTSSIQGFLAGRVGSDTALIEAAISHDDLFFPAVVLTEVLNDPELKAAHAERVRQLPLLDLKPGYWDRAGMMRSVLLAMTLKSKIPDVLIAQSCIDHDIPLITYDRDFRHFVRAGLKLA